ncbi:MAG: methyltransferase domain-containing protein [Bacteroidota bacterium]|nr:methyltransferase domain-containing protein [Bacteroidota bacterium]MDP4233156.1 methyltransferase domain-containing protein [Bacteroidota bacterium]MDP4241699.1 methyltransferase domain-containing protein [Bacteroidota bacterium]MDP4287357.1 methyltransferase domain-containing protein [Bacteroidota bacterium]
MKTVEFFSEAAYNWETHYASDPRFRRRFLRITHLLDRILPRTPGRALDMGCGTGVFSRELASRGWRVTAVDSSENMIEQARSIPHVGEIEFSTSTIEAYQAAPSSYEVIVAFSMLEYVEDDEAAIAKLVAMLAPHGILIVSVPNRVGLLRRLEGLVFGIREISRDRVFSNRGEYLKHQKRQYSPFELDLMMRQTGLRKKRAIFLNGGITSPAWLLPLAERRLVAAMYCACYEKV